MMPNGNMLGVRSGGKMPLTRWSIVMRAGQKDMVQRNKALTELYSIYWNPVYDFIRMMGRPEEEARDLTQEFFATHVIKNNDVAVADQHKGRFRNWLLTAVKHHLANDLKKKKAKKRNPGTPILSIDTPETDEECPIQVGHHVTAEKIYERRWAMILLSRALEKLQQSYEKRGEKDLFEKIKPLLTGVEAERNQVIAKQLDMREGTFNVAVCRCRSQFQKRIRAEIAETVSHEEQIEDELRYLYSGLQTR